LERAIRRLTGDSLRVRGASRTDAGAHARGQVADFLTRAPYTTETFIRALNWYLPPDIKVRGACQTSPGFHSRKDAISRVYRYTILNDRCQSALLRHFSHWVSAPLNVPKMREAAGYLPGTHDFSALVVSLPLGRRTVRRVERWDVWREGELVLIEAEADGFLPHQIRRTNGILTQVGLGKMSMEVIKRILDGTIKELKHCPSVPAKGLCLMKVNYPSTLSRIENDYEAI